ncbi:MAG: hypothetical protein JW888_09785 [Pirellulales bacterium]|nr:hypothetical protein [Pirellulales bacterium]
MVIRKRETVLAWVTLTLLALVALQYAYSTLHGPRDGLEKLQTKLAGEIERKNTRLRNARLAAEQLDKRRRQSLPSDPQRAQSLYQSWLLQAASDAGFSNTKIKSLRGQSSKGVYSALRFTLHARTPLTGLTKFLYHFYHANHLHQILSLTMTPDEHGTSLGIVMTIEALSLNDAIAKDSLTEATSDRPLAKLDLYQEKIGQRNLFASYSPPSPPSAPPPDDSVDPLKHTELNTIVSVDGRPQVWINSKMTGKQYRLFEGEEAEIEETKCKVLRIGDRDAHIEIDGKPYLVLLGTALYDGKRLSSDQ